MTIPNMAFNPTDGLRNATEYPTVPASEAALRDAVQQQSDQLRDFINNTLLPKVLDKTGDMMTGKFTMSGGAGTETQGGASKIQIAGGYPSPITGKMIIGDGSGWKFVMSKKDVGGTLTDLIEFLDSGAIKSNGNTLLQTVSGGYKLQSGSIAAASSTSYTITFPTAFLTTPIVTVGYFSNGATSGSVVVVTAASTTGATFYLTAGASGGQIYWHAIGS